MCVMKAQRGVSNVQASEGAAAGCVVIETAALEQRGKSWGERGAGREFEAK